MQEKIKKLLMLSTSPNDHEALSAIRKAQAILASNNKCWTEFIDGIKTIEPEFNFDQQQNEQQGIDIDEMLSECLTQVKGSAVEFIESLNEFYEEKGFLTSRQEEALRKFYRNCK